MSKSPKLILGAHFPGKEQVSWRHPENKSMIDVDSYRENALAAEEANYHFLFLAESLSLAESKGEILSHTVNGRPDTVGIQTALAGITRTVGFVNTLSATYNEPYDLARQLATLDLLSDGRAAWNLVTSAPPGTTANFTQGDFLPYADRYTRAEEFLKILLSVWRGWGAAQDLPRPIAFTGKHFNIRGETSWRSSTQDRPVVFQAGGSKDGSVFAARFADAVYIIPSDIEAARRSYAQAKAPLADQGRGPEDLKVIAGLRFVVGDTDAEAKDKFEHYLDLEFADQDIRTELERVWLRDLSDLDPDGPLPSSDPDWEALAQVLAKSPGLQRDPRKYVAQWREVAEVEKLSARGVVKRLVVRPAIHGTPETIADQIEQWVDTKAADGFIVQPQVVPLGTVEFARRVVPVLVERGLFRSDAPDQTLRESLGLPPSIY